MDTMIFQNLRPFSYSDLRNFTEPHLHKTKKWYIDFNAKDPATGRMKRKKYYVKMYRSIRMRNKVASEMLAFLTSLLYAGWTPWATDDYSAGMTPFADCLDMYLRHVSLYIKKNTRDSYSSRVKVLRDFIKTQEKPILMACQFDTSFCCSFLDYIFIEKQDTARTRNNYRDWLFTLAEFLRLRNVIKYNPVDSIGKLKVNVKQRKRLTESMLQRLGAYLKKHDKHFYLACLMQYYALIRPNELSLIKIGDIKVKEQIVYLHAEDTKNGKDDVTALNKKILLQMIDLGVLSSPPDYYLFSHNCKPGKAFVGPDNFNKKWKAIRETFGWKECFKFYSLKDSGIEDLANKEGIIVARDQARHADVSTTNKYVQEQPVRECVKDFNGAL